MQMALYMRSYRLWPSAPASCNRYGQTIKTLAAGQPALTTTPTPRSPMGTPLGPPARLAALKLVRHAIVVQYDLQGVLGGPVTRAHTQESPPLGRTEVAMLDDPACVCPGRAHTCTHKQRIVLTSRYMAPRLHALFLCVFM